MLHVAYHPCTFANSTGFSETSKILHWWLNAEKNYKSSQNCKAHDRDASVQ